MGNDFKYLFTSNISQVSRDAKALIETLEHGGGYDAKNMMHTFRLLQMAKEIATTGKPLVRRPDRDELLEIKSGQFTYDELMAKAAEELRQIDECYATCNLPDEPDTCQIEQWAIAIRRAWYAEGDAGAMGKP